MTEPEQRILKLCLGASPEEAMDVSSDSVSVSTTFRYQAMGMSTVSVEDFFAGMQKAYQEEIHSALNKIEEQVKALTAAAQVSV